MKARPDLPISPMPSDRSKRWIEVTVVVQLLSFLLYPMFICGCHFHSDAIPASVAPIAWGFYPIAFFRTKKERIAGYFTTALSLFWIFFAWESNIQFAFQ